MIRVVSANLNGIRSAATKGFFDWMDAHQADFVCVQELKAHEADLAPGMIAPPGYVGHFHCAQKKGYSGVGIYARREPREVVVGLGDPQIDAEGRCLELVYDRLSVVSVYLPSGSSGDDRQAAKFAFMARFQAHLARLVACGREVVICGDWNIAHKPIDLENWRANQKNPGFLPEERAWVDGVIDVLGFVDVYRRIEPGGGQYTWWSNRGQAWAKNVGWRLDYQLATPRFAATATRVSIYKDQRFSDHAPLTIDYDYTLP